MTRQAKHKGVRVMGRLFFAATIPPLVLCLIATVWLVKALNDCAAEHGGPCEVVIQLRDATP